MKKDIKDLNLNFSSFGKESKSIILLLLGLIVVIGLLIFSINNFYPKITTYLSDIEKIEKDIQVFSNKAESLKVISEKLPDNMIDVTIALPENEPVLFVYTNIKRLTVEHSLEIESVKIELGKQDKTEKLTKSVLGMSVFGKKDDMIGFVEDIKNIAPATTINSLEFDEYSEDEVVDMRVSVQAYSSDLPTQIPSERSSIQKLRPDEEEVIEEILGLTSPPVKEFKPQDKNSSKINPFNFVITLPNVVTEESSE